ncbi:MAG: hypothetical protein NT062_26110 [Proteobacteria bacterium]|nr:hypothetical protein [Pseudomonadota bacterium]
MEGLGFVGDFDKAIGLAITIPRSMTAVPIDQAHYSIGARYRLGVGKASVLAFGASYEGRQFIANRTNLGGSELDTPDVDYQAIAPHGVLGTPVTPTMNLDVEVRALLLLKTGAISTSAQYGAGTAYGAELRGGLDVKLGGALALRILAEYSQVSISFKGGTLSPNQRGVTAATDRSIGLAATLALTY